MVRNGRARERKVTIGSGTLAVRAPRVNDRRVDEESGERKRSAAGLSSSTISRLCKDWETEHERFRTRSLRFHKYAYWFVDGVHVSVRLGEDDRLCLLVVIGVREDGVKELLAVEDGYRESTESWAAVMRDLKNRGLNEPKLVSCDMASWITGPVAERCPNASVCYDPFHLVALATDALDEIRRDVWNEARRQGQQQLARELKGARFALWKNPANLTERQELKLARVQQLNQRLYRAYLLAQQLREIYRVPYAHAITLLDAWLAWARRCRLEPFVKLARTITQQRSGIEAALRHGLSNECTSHCTSW